MTKIAGSGSVIQRHGSADPDPIKDSEDYKDGTQYLKKMNNQTGAYPDEQSFRGPRRPWRGRWPGSRPKGAARAQAGCPARK